MANSGVLIKCVSASLIVGVDVCVVRCENQWNTDVVVCVEVCDGVSLLMQVYGCECVCVWCG